MASPYPQVVLFGDSLFEQSVEVQNGFCFQTSLQIRCIRRFDVVNRGFSGYNTKNAVEYLSRIFPEPTESSPKIKYFFLLLGANDAVLDMPTTSQHVPMDQYKENLIKIITHPNILAHKPKMFIVTPPPVDEIKIAKLDKEGGHAGPTRKSAVSAAYSQTVRDVAKEHPEVTLVDLWQAIMDAAIAMAPGDYQPGGPWLGSPENGKQGGLDELLPDGLHMSGEAYQVFYKAIRSLIDVPVEKVFPDWSELNPIPKQ